MGPDDVAEPCDELVGVLRLPDQRWAHLQHVAAGAGQAGQYAVVDQGFQQ
ncbi:MAG: hypothetical protein QOI78_6888 [Actinomycetota bacterium]|nr:hypothetical protein [Actinomycetota bacterium]